MIKNELSLLVATVNGSGSQSSNMILLRSLFRMGLPVGGKNLFPSNIAGLPTWFSIRVNQSGYTSMEEKADIVIAINRQTAQEDLAKVKKGGLFLHAKGVPLDTATAADNVRIVEVDFLGIAGTVSKSIKLKKLLTNMVYVGLIGEALGIPQDVIEGSVEQQFQDKTSVIDINKQAVEAGATFFKTENPFTCNYSVESLEAPKNKILIDGNTSGAMGSVVGGCTVAAWYPITPSSSLAENFESYCKKWRVKDGVNHYAMVQAEDELSAISMVTGAGWAGARAMTATSGPGLSLMAECAGLMYFAEVPGVLWDVQRAGPSTGLPTRTMQGDVLSAALLSHGDAKHPVLLPANPYECFEFAQIAFDMAERLQTLIIVLSDLDIGMNSWVSDDFEYPKTDFDRGKVLTQSDLEKLTDFARYEDKDGDGIPYRTLPGTEHDLAGYFTRGTGHDDSAKYTEDADTFRVLLDRLNKKWETAKTLLPKPIEDANDTAKIGIIAYGSTDCAMQEIRDSLSKDGMNTSYLRVRAFPFSHEVQEYIEKYDTILVVEQNRDGQLKTLLTQEYPQLAAKMSSILNYDGLPVCAQKLSQKITSEVTHG